MSRLIPIASQIMLIQREVAAYLLERQLIDASALVESDLIVEDISRRNHNFKVISERGPCYLLKQGIESDGIATVAREAAMYELLQQHAENTVLESYLPHYYGYDSREHILIVELLRNAHDLRAYHARSARFSTTVAAALGEMLGTLHRLTKPDEERFAQQLPWVLFADRPSLHVLQSISSANLQLIQIIQHSPEFRRSLDELRQGWQATTLIHYDFKWDNCIVPAQPVSKRSAGLKLIDWEAAGIGDPCWDAGSVFSDYLSFWLLSIPVTGDAPPDRFMELARYPLERMQPAIHAYWRAYIRRMELDVATADHWLLRATRYAAARLIQTAFEQTQMAMHLNGNIVCLLQLSLNIMRRPQEASVQLLGLPLRPVRVA